MNYSNFVRAPPTIDSAATRISTQGMDDPCFLLGGGTVGEIVDFQRSGSKVVSFTILGLYYGVVFNKVS